MLCTPLWAFTYPLRYKCPWFRNAKVAFNVNFPLRRRLCPHVSPQKCAVLCCALTHLWIQSSFYVLNASKDRCRRVFLPCVLKFVYILDTVYVVCMQIYVWSLCVWALARNLYLEDRARRLCLFIVHWELVWKVWTLIFRTEFPEKCSCLTCFNLYMLTDLCRYSVIATGLRSSQNVRQMLLVCSPLHSCSKGNLYFPEQDLFWVIA
jgi:hypothetical protein